MIPFQHQPNPAVLITVTLVAVAAFAAHRYGEHCRAQGYIDAMRYRCTSRAPHDGCQP